MPIQAGPLAGDHDVVHLRVGAGATLELVPVAATLALPGPARTRLELHAEVAGRLILDEPPLIVPAGADVLRTTRIALAAGAVAAWRDTVVLGRAGEGPGRLEATTRVTLAGAPLLHETLRIDPERGDAYVALGARAPGHRDRRPARRARQPRRPGRPWSARPACDASDVEARLREAWGVANAPVHHRRLIQTFGAGGPKARLTRRT